MVPGRALGPLVLASASPRRREILAALGVDFRAVAPEVEEATQGAPEDVVVENARRKARAVATSAEDADITLGADTEVVLEGRVLGKPANEGEAHERLMALSGRTHVVLTGLVALEAGAVAERSGVARSEVTFAELDASTLDLYVASGEWRDRAGGYAIQGLGSLLVERVEGDFSNVVGLPLPLLFQLVPQAGEAAARGR